MSPGYEKCATASECSLDATAAGADRTAGYVSPTKPAEWDSIIVGSSPLLLLESIYLGRTGRKVLLLEQKDQLGGAWGHLNCEEFPNLDIGCHYIDISKRAYEFLGSNFELNLVPLRPQPQFAYYNIRFPYDYKQMIRFIRYTRAALKNRALGRFITDLIQDENYRLRLFPFTKTFLFPRGGSLELMTKLTAHALENNVTIRKMMHVESIRFDSKRQQVRVSAGGKSFAANEIVVGSQARVADALHITPRPEGTSRRVFTHVNLVFADNSAPSFSYVRFLRHHAVIRMTDISNNVRHATGDMSGYRVICIGIRENYDRRVDDSKKVEQLTALLKKYRFIDPSAKFERSYWSRYPAEFQSADTKMLLRDLFPMVRLISTTNLSTGIVNNLDRWAHAFEPNRFSHECYNDQY